eukprot:scaffold6697_cov262-Amphora_coffeaeformis.AAC.3
MVTFHLNLDKLLRVYFRPWSTVIGKDEHRPNDVRVKFQSVQLIGSVHHTFPQNFLDMIYGPTAMGQSVVGKILTINSTLDRSLRYVGEM